MYLERKCMKIKLFLVSAVVLMGAVELHGAQIDINNYPLGVRSVKALHKAERRRQVLRLERDRILRPRNIGNINLIAAMDLAEVAGDVAGVANAHFILHAQDRQRNHQRQLFFQARFAQAAAPAPAVNPADVAVANLNIAGINLNANANVIAGVQQQQMEVDAESDNEDQ